MNHEATHCMYCGTPLIKRYLKSEETEIPYCPQCEEFRFPVFNTAVSVIVRNPAKDRILLIKQYGKDSYILTAGYVNKGEDAETAVRREVKEELGLNVTDLSFNRSSYYEKSNTLMLNFTAVTDSDELHPNEEIDSFTWFTEEEARANIRPGSLARSFLLSYLDQR